MNRVLMVAHVFWGVVGLGAFVYTLIEAPPWGKAMAVMIAASVWQLSQRSTKD